MVREVKNLTNIRLTESGTDGIWLHFEAKGVSAGVLLSALLGHGGVVDRAIQAWAREQLDKQEIAHLPPAPPNEFLKEGNEVRTSKSSIRPSPPVDGGY